MRTTAKHKESSSKAKSTSFFSPTTLQPKLTIGQPNDKYEQEADAMADKVMRMPQNGIQRTCVDCEKKEGIQMKQESNPSTLDRKIQGRPPSEEETLQTKPLMMKSESGGGVATSALTSQLNSSKGSGSPLPASTNNFMSNAFGTDFSNVRVHTGSNAIQMNQGLNARAFTHGSDVYFNKGEYSPTSSEGKRLLGHELTHVVQQSNSVQRESIQRDFDWERAGIGTGIGTLGGGLVGAGIGAAVGGPVGALAGGLIGGAVGALGGGLIGGLTGKSSCCDDAKAKGLDGGDYGGIICCNNKKFNCVWPSNIRATNSKARSIIIDCVRKHEATHMNDVNCSGAKLERPPFKAGLSPNKEECAAYKVEKSCYDSSIASCGTDNDCRTQVQSELDFAKSQISSLC